MGNSSSSPVNKARRPSNRLSKPPTDPATLAHLKAQTAQPSETTIRPQSSKRTQQASSRADLASVEKPATEHDVAQRRQSQLDLGRRHSGQETEPKIRSGFGSFVGGLPDRLSRSRSALSHIPDSSPHEAEEWNTTDRSPLSFVPESEPMIPDLSSQYVQEEENETLDGSLIGMDPERSPSPGLVHDNQLASCRRKSLHTPGIATRTRSGRCPSIPESHNGYYGYNHLTNPIVWSQNYQDSLATPHQVTSPQPRVSTPTQLEYRQLGGLKPGTLRITNGYPPATPNDQAQRKSSNQLSSDQVNTKAHHKPTRKERTPQANPSSHLAHDESGLGLQFNSHVDQRTLEFGQTLQQIRASNPMETEFRDDKPLDNPPLLQNYPDTTNDLLSTPSEFPTRFIDSPFSFEVSPTRVTIPTIDEFDDRSFEDEGVDISHGNTEYQNPDSEPLENGPGKDTVGSLKDRPEQPLKKADSGYSSATSAYSKRTNSSPKRVGINTLEEGESFSDKVTGWNSVGNNDDYRESRQPRFDAPLPENDVISQPSRSSGRQLNSYHTYKSVSHLRQTENPVRSSRLSRERPMEVESSPITFQDSFSASHLPQEHAHNATAIHHRESSQTQTPQAPLELTASCGCVLRFPSLNDPHSIHNPDEARLPPRCISAPVPAPLSSRTDETIPRAQSTCTCGAVEPPHFKLPTSHQPKPGKLTRRRRSSGVRGMSLSSNGDVDLRSQETLLENYSSNLSRDRRQSSDTLRARISVGHDPQMSRRQSFASLASMSPSEYREQPFASREPSLWGEDTSVYSENSSLAETQRSPKQDQGLIPPVPPLPTNIKTKRSVSEQLGLTQNKTGNPNRGSQPRKLVKPQKGASRHPRDSRIMVHGNF